MKDPETVKAVLEEKEKGVSLGVVTTPSFFINGKLVVGLNGLQQEIASLDENTNPNASAS